MAKKKKEKKEKKPKSKVRKILEWVGTGIFAALIVFTAVILFTTKIQRKNSSNPNAPAKIGNLYFPVLVLTGSMEPDYPVNSALFIAQVDCNAVYNEFINSYNDETDTYTARIDLTFDDCYTKRLDEEVYVTTLFEKDYYSGRTTMDNLMHTMTHRVFYIHVDETKAYGEGRYHFYVNGINKSAVAGAESQYQVFTENQLYGRVTGCSKFVGAIFTFAESPWGLIILLVIPSLYMIISSVIDVARAYKDDDEPVTENANTTNKKTSNADPLAGLSEKDKKRLKEEMLEDIMEGKDKKGKK